MTILKLLRLTPGITHLTLRGYVFPHILEHMVSEGLLPMLNHLMIGVSVARAYNLMPTTGRAIGELVKSKEREGILKSIHMVDRDITTKFQVELGGATRFQILYRSKEALGRLSSREPHERESEEAQFTVEMFADLWRGMLHARECGVNILNQNIELFDFMLTAMEKCETADYRSFLRAEPDLKCLVNGCMLLDPPPGHVDAEWGHIRVRFLQLVEKWRAIHKYNKL
ncbi:hypothetical protein PQX77_012540 [Marasmius sp. AFHP31]|nr:hypothetical protein PQX77_012540 [Marasmius sp. AFHP31]